MWFSVKKDTNICVCMEVLVLVLGTCMGRTEMQLNEI